MKRSRFLAGFAFAAPAAISWPAAAQTIIGADAGYARSNAIR
jgi:hypothetical protein